MRGKGFEDSIEMMWSTLRSGKPFFIAEAGVNHLGSLEIAEDLIRKAARSGADAIKFQSYKASSLCTRDAPRFWDWDGEIDKGGSQFDSYSILDSFGEKEHVELKRMCDENNIEFMSTPFDNHAVDYLNRVGIRAYKVASCDITNHPLLKHIGSKRKIVMLSTGASTLDEIKSAISVLESSGTDRIVIMHCNLKYPTEKDEINLKMIESLKVFFGEKYAYGLSDHTTQIETPSFSVMLGANIVEKHYTIDKTLGKSADHWFSVDPAQVKQITKMMSLAYSMVGNIESKQCTPGEQRARSFARRSIVSSRKISSGEKITTKDVAFKRPGTGISPSRLQSFLGRKVTKDVDEDHIFCEDDFERIEHG
jgi:sialic acid synthase SpsE